MAQTYLNDFLSLEFCDNDPSALAGRGEAGTHRDSSLARLKMIFARQAKTALGCDFGRCFLDVTPLTARKSHSQVHSTCPLPGREAFQARQMELT
jgi:hypothetical protein